MSVAIIGSLGETIHLSVDCDKPPAAAQADLFLGETIHLSVDCDHRSRCSLLHRLLGETIHLSVDCDELFVLACKSHVF